MNFLAHLKFPLKLKKKEKRRSHLPITYEPLNKSLEFSPKSKPRITVGQGQWILG